MERGIRKCLTFVIRPIASKFSEKYYSRKDSSSPRKSVFNVFRRKQASQLKHREDHLDTSDVFGNIRSILPLTHRNSAKLLSSSYKAMRNTLFNFVVLNTLQKRKHFFVRNQSFVGGKKEKNLKATSVILQKFPNSCTHNIKNQRQNTKLFLNRK